MLQGNNDQLIFQPSNITEKEFYESLSNERREFYQSLSNERREFYQSLTEAQREFYQLIYKNDAQREFYQSLDNPTRKFYQLIYKNDAQREFYQSLDNPTRKFYQLIYKNDAQRNFYQTILDREQRNFYQTVLNDKQRNFYQIALDDGQRKLYDSFDAQQRVDCQSCLYHKREGFFDDIRKKFYESLDPKEFYDSLKNGVEKDFYQSIYKYKSQREFYESLSDAGRKAYISFDDKLNYRDFSPEVRKTYESLNDVQRRIYTSLSSQQREESIESFDKIRESFHESLKNDGEKKFYESLQDDARKDFYQSIYKYESQRSFYQSIYKDESQRNFYESLRDAVQRDFYQSIDSWSKRFYASLKNDAEKDFYQSVYKNTEARKTYESFTGTDRGVFDSLKDDDYRGFYGIAVQMQKSEALKLFGIERGNFIYRPEIVSYVNALNKGYFHGEDGMRERFKEEYENFQRLEKERSTTPLLQKIFNALPRSEADKPHIIYLGLESYNNAGGYYIAEDDTITLFQEYTFASLILGRSFYDINMLVHESLHKLAHTHNNGKLIEEKKKMLDEFLEQFPPSLHSAILEETTNDFAILTSGALSDGYVERLRNAPESEKKSAFLHHIFGEVITRTYDYSQNCKIERTYSRGTKIYNESAKFFIEILEYETEALKKCGIFEGQLCEAEKALSKTIQKFKENANNKKRRYSFTDISSEIVKTISYAEEAPLLRLLGEIVQCAKKREAAGKSTEVLEKLKQALLEQIKGHCSEIVQQHLNEWEKQQIEGSQMLSQQDSQQKQTQQFNEEKPFDKQQQSLRSQQKQTQQQQDNVVSKEDLKKASKTLSKSQEVAQSDKPQQLEQSQQLQGVVRNNYNKSPGGRPQ
ncbi:hypothetical protein Fsol_00366 [Candidatus Fokinia solitaria]|uniref:RGS domain-containing protein n=1 Tax=Candidatus Fokinia solitaria TaxID=1802984 RepID=A0A2U8BS30_9RICK|nr:hypothetical protein [Candidatus Fokinia solitaria]AWD33164.1 hypothetical protein Fsol_00366 [Candidatus Fokinia solitaria]